ncbi:MAG: hypothetical protein Ta2A_17050 [Treponemataceae bacterium]|nr:MAG: hypothetical protein Ta2A_17050 [Treponemataceae bacterium]
MGMGNMGETTKKTKVIRAEGVHTPPLGAEKGYAHLSAIPREKQHTPLLAAGLLIAHNTMRTLCAIFAGCCICTLYAQDTGDSTSSIEHSVFNEIIAAMDTVRVEAQVAHNAKIEALAYSPDGLYLASASDDHTVKIWDTFSGRVFKTIFLHSAAVTSVGFDASGSRLVSADSDGLIIVQRTSDWKTIAEFQHDAEVNTAVFAAGGTKIISGGSDGIIRVWDLASRASLFVIRAHAFAVEQIVCSINSNSNSNPNSSLNRSENADFFASCSLDGTVRVWSLTHGRQIRLFTLPDAKAVALSADGKFLAAGGSTKAVKIWELKTGAELFSMENIAHEILSLDFSPDGTAVAVGLNAAQFAFWDYANGEMLLYDSFQKARQNSYTTSVIFSPDNNHFAVSSVDASIRIWNIDEYRSEYMLQAENIRFDAKSFDEFFADNLADNRTVFPQRELIFDALANGVHYDISPNGGVYKLEGEGTTDVVMRNTKTGDFVESLYSHVKPIISARFSVTGKYIVSVARDNTIKIWDMETKALRYTIAEIGIISKAVFSADDKKLVTLSYDGTIRIWDAASGELLLLFVAYNNNDWLCITPDGYYNSSANGELYLNLVADGKSIPYPYSTVEDFRSLLFDPRVISKRLSMQ